MSSGSKQQVGTTAQTVQVPEWQEDYVKEVSGQAQNFWEDRNKHYNPYAGQTQADLSGATQAGLGQIEKIAGYGNPLASDAYNEARDLIGSGGLGQGSRNVLQNMNEFAVGGGQEDPRLQRQLDINAERVGSQVNSAMSGAGRYGSFAHGGELAERIGEINNPVMLAANEAARGRQMQANQMMSGIYDAGLNRSAGLMGMSPQLEQGQYAAADRLGQVGAFLDNRAQNDINAQIEKWNIEQAHEGEALARYSAIIKGMGGLGGSQTSTIQTQPGPSTMQQILGGGLASAGILGKFF